jgi:RHS repeat-associated protein
MNNLTSITDPNFNVTTYAYDDYGNAVSVLSPVGGTQVFAFDADDNLKSLTDGNNIVSNYTYDSADRLINAVSDAGFANQETVTWSYDDPTSGHYGIGRLSSVASSGLNGANATTKSFSYERRGLLASESDLILGNQRSTSYAFDNNGNLQTLQYPDSTIATYGYDFADRPYSVTMGGTQVVQSAIYEPFGPISRLTYQTSPATIHTWTYDQEYRPLEDTVTGASTLADHSYQFDSGNNVLAILDNLDHTDFDRHFVYDDLNRMTSSTSGTQLWGTAQYNYDTVGNITSQSVGSRADTFNQKLNSSSLSTSEISSVVENGNQAAVSYDGAGNETNVGTSTYTYSAREHLATGDGNSYVYDGVGMRAASINSSNQSSYFYYGMDGALIADTTPAAIGTPPINGEYLYFNSLPVAQIDGLGVHFDITNDVGAPFIQTNSAGSASWQADYDPYGNIWDLRNSTQAHEPLRLPGQLSDDGIAQATSSLTRQYNANRWYRPGWGRYSQADPIGLAGGNNMYAYGLENPETYADPSGLAVWLAQHPITSPVDISNVPIVPDFPMYVYHGMHLFLILDPYNILTEYPRYNGPCVKFISGEPSDLLLTTNYDADRSQQRGKPIQINPYTNLSDDELIDLLLDESASFQQNTAYIYNPVPYFFSYNSASYIAGMLHAADMHGQNLISRLPGNHTGAAKPVPDSAFSNGYADDSSETFPQQNDCGCLNLLNAPQR